MTEVAAGREAIAVMVAAVAAAVTAAFAEVAAAAGQRIARRQP